jgi:hypothetical protein
MLVFGWKMKCFVKYDYLDCHSGRTRRVEASYEEIATVASLPRNDILNYDVRQSSNKSSPLPKGSHNAIFTNPDPITNLHQ